MMNYMSPKPGSTFQLHEANEEQVEKIELFIDVFNTIAEHVKQFTPSSREQSLAITKLEEAFFFTHAAIARHG